MGNAQAQDLCPDRQYENGLSVSGAVQQHAIASPRTSKKRSFLASLSKGTQRKGTIITRPMNQESMPEEPFEEVKEGDAERIRIMKMVKEGILSVEEAMEQAKNLGIMTAAAEPTNDDGNGDEKIFNFGVYKYGRDRTSLTRRILQFDFQEKVLCIIQKGNRNKKFAFTDIRGFDSEDGVRFYIYFDSDYELDADSVEEKNKICHLLDSIVQQNRGDELDGEFIAPSLDAAKIIKEGQIEKKGHSAAFMMWPRRWLRIQQGELSYFKIGEENQTALNIVKLGPGLAEVKSVDHNAFIIITSKKEYSFRVVNLNNAGDSAVERERDAWVEAIAAASQVNFRKSRAISSIPDEAAVATSVAEQEKYLKDVVRTLQRELEQLASVLSVVNAPIQATVQVKKVKDVVRNLDSQVKTGVLSWTMRQVLQSRKDSLREGNASVPQLRKESQKDSSTHAPQFTSTSPPRRKDSDRLPSLPPQRDDGYEAVQIPQWSSKAKPVPVTPAEQSPSEYSAALPPRPHKPSEMSSTPSSGSTPQQTVPPVRPSRSSSSSVNPYETVEIVPQKPQAQQSSQGSDAAIGEPWSSHKPPRPPKPGSENDDSNIYQEPPKPVSVIPSRDDVYDNVHIKNIPLSTKDGESQSGSPASLGTFTGDTSDSGVIRNDIASSHPQEIKHEMTSAPNTEVTDGKLEIDSGGMGCKNIEKAMEERRQILKETETKEGVVLLSVQKLKEKGSELIETHASEEIGDVADFEEARPTSGSNPPPPPPLPPGGVPPPPPLMATGLDGVPGRACAVQSKVKLRPFFWNKVPAQMVTSSVWMSVADRTKSINLELLEEMFQIEEKEKTLNAAPTKPAAKTLLDPKRAQNLGIFLSGFKLSTKEIDEKLSVFREEDGALPMDHVIALKRFLPSTEDSEMYKNYKEDPSTLVPEDQFMMKLCEINDLEKRLDLLLVIMEFPTQFEDLAPNVNNLLQACKELYNSKNFLLVLEYVLSVGNILNAGSNRGGAYGFRLQSLPKLADIRGNNKKYTLLKFLILQLQQANPEALNFPDELKSVPKAAACSSKALFAEVEVMKKDLIKIKRHSSELFLKRNQTNPKDVKLHNDVEAFVNEYEAKLNELCDKCKEMKQIYNKVLASFGETQSSDSEELFAAISTFMTQFKKAVKEQQHGSKHNKGIKLEGLREAIAQRQKSTDDTISIASMSSLSSTATAFDQDSVDAGKTSRNEQPSTGNRDIILERKPSNKDQNTPSNGPPPVIHKQLSKKTPPKPPTRADPKPTKQGFLAKLSGGKHQTPKWDNRYFELSDTGYLYYYKKPDGGKPINSIYLRGCPVEIDPNDPCVVLVKTDERDWSLKAVNAEEACVWKDALSFYTDKQN
ncbi:hypothetical protein ACROYT_G011488 [Oculina patagonica]